MTAYWPFCVAASAEADYRLIAAPDFLIQAEELDFFRKRSFKLTEPTTVPVSALISFDGVDGQFACGYCAARSVLCGIPQTDRADRPLFHAIGFIATPIDLAVDDIVKFYEASTRAVHSTLERFLTGDVKLVLPVSTKRFEFRPEQSGGER